MNELWDIKTGDCREMLGTLPERSVQCVVTSPPYWGQRDYGTAEWDGGDSSCDHVESELRRGVNLARSHVSTRGGGKKIATAGTVPYKTICAKCGAARVDQGIGLEADVEAWVDAMVEVFRKVRRVLRDDGTLWLNLGDKYNNNPKGSLNGQDKSGLTSTLTQEHSPANIGGLVPGLKVKDLIGLPWRVAFALQADGWYLRRDIIWHKPNPMPESATDRPSTAHEYMFLLTKSGNPLFWSHRNGESQRTKPDPDYRWTLHDEERTTPPPGWNWVMNKCSCHRSQKDHWKRRNLWTGHDYFYDGDAVRVPVTGNAHARGNGVNPKAYESPAGWDTSSGTGDHGSIHRNGREKGRIKQNPSFSSSVNELVTSSNLRSVWSIATQAFDGPHYATYPEKLVEPCIKAGTSERGECPECGAPWRRSIESTGHVNNREPAHVPGLVGTKTDSTGWSPQNVATDDWRPTCDHGGEPVPQTVLDPFSGAGTTGLVAARFGRNYIGLELNPEYAEMSRRRIDAWYRQDLQKTGVLTPEHAPDDLEVQGLLALNTST